MVLFQSNILHFARLFVDLSIFHVSGPGRPNGQPRALSAQLTQPPVESAPEQLTANARASRHTPTLELTHKDNQTIFTLNSVSAAADSSNLPNSTSDPRSDPSDSRSDPSDPNDSSQFQSLENRRSKLLETLQIKGSDARTRPVMEVKPRPTSTSSTAADSPTRETPAAGRHILKGAKPVFPKTKPKPVGKRPSQNNKQSAQESKSAGELA